MILKNILIGWMGCCSNIVSKVPKYTLFDSVKEMLYISLDNKEKQKGKAAVDVIGARLGKSGGGLIHSTIFILIPSYTFVQATPFFTVIFF